MQIYKFLWKSMKINENHWKSMKINRKTMKIYENLWKSIEIYENLWKSMEIYENPKIYVFWKRKMGYLLYSKHINASNICPQREINCLNRENENAFLQGNMEFDLQITCQSHLFYENMKWSHGHYGHFAPSGFPQTHTRRWVFDKLLIVNFW